MSTSYNVLSQSALDDFVYFTTKVTVNNDVVQFQIDNLQESLDVEVKNWLNGLQANEDKARLAKEIIALAMVVVTYSLVLRMKMRMVIIMQLHQQKMRLKYLLKMLSLALLRGLQNLHVNAGWDILNATEVKYYTR